MSLVGSCPSCGSSNIVDDDLYAQAQLVCADCGCVVSEGVLADDPVGGSDVSYSRTTAVTKQPCLNHRKGLERVKEICRILRLRLEIEDLAQTYFKQAFEHESFIRVTLQKKEVLAGCCVLLSCRQLNWPITIGTISCLLNADPALVGGVYLEMLKILNVEPSTLNITDVLEAHCREYKISSSHVPEELAEDSKDLMKRAVALVELAAHSWIVTGRRPVPIMMATIYLAWQSLNPNKLRLKFSLGKFCQLAKVQKSKPALARTAELKETLCKLGKEIPWVGETVTPGNVVKLVGDILEHRYVLLSRALRTHEDTMQAEHQSGPVDPPTGEMVQISERVDQTAAASSVEQLCSRNERDKQAEEGDAPDCEPNWGKRLLFAPPCVIHAKKRRVEQPMLEVTGDEEISDSEIDSYIRSPREVRDFIRTQEVLSSSSSGTL
ncbi:transcription factor IIIB 50 kDa subunit [Austrofundulus limnaeus]|uniref:Transcription factor IIIB 50 kDa subunit n=1 Tax=Austrofundulus limnaeus TaxID=52670 RepID=A0A2I4AUR9_AUSLI|nr:PREDICTED: transcription factor IIIB 50 kDa subunit [Austrofundulus limnaeus]